MESRKHSALKENKMQHQNLQDAAKAVFTGKYIS